MLVKDKEYLDFSSVPQSKGIPRFLPILAAIALAGILVMAGSVVALSGYGHYWPGDRTLRVDLGKK